MRAPATLSNLILHADHGGCGPEDSTLAVHISHRFPGLWFPLARNAADISHVPFFINIIRKGDPGMFHNLSVSLVGQQSLANTLGYGKDEHAVPYDFCRRLLRICDYALNTCIRTNMPDTLSYAQG